MKATLHYIANTNSSGFNSVGKMDLEGADIHLDTEEVDEDSGEGFVEVTVFTKITPLSEANEEDVERSIILNAKNFIMLDRTVSEEERTEMKETREKAEAIAEETAKAQGPLGGFIPGRTGRAG